MHKVRPFLKWAGNKYHCMEHLLALFPPAQRLLEPFAGSAAVFMNTNYPHHILAEQNQDLIALYACLQQEGDHFIADCQKLFVPEHNTQEYYYRFRTRFNQITDQRARACLFLYLNRHGYNGLCRYNARGLYNVPFGRYLKPYFPKQEMQFFHQKSQNLSLLHSDFRQTFLLANAGDLVYCDPPYVPIQQDSNFSAYTGKSFTRDEQGHLLSCALDAVRRGITVIISNHDTEFTRFYYRDAEISAFKVRRFINCKAKERLLVPELLAIFRP